MLMKLPLLLALVLALAAVAVPVWAEEDAAAAEEEETTEPLTVEEILKRDPTRAEYVEDDKCIPARRIKEVEVIDDKHVAIRMSRGQYYLVQFEHRCIDLRRGRPVYIERHNASLCRHDVIHGLRDTGLGGFERGQPCRIPGFQSVTKEQIVLLKDALAAERRAKRRG